MNETEAYIAECDPSTAGLMSAARELILRCSPAITESIKYGIPFYTYRRSLCYLNPTKGGVNIGFARGAELSNANGILTGIGKQVRHIYLAHGKEIPERSILETLYEAMMIEENIKTAK